MEAALLPLDAGGFGTAETVALLISGEAVQVALVAGGLGFLRPISYAATARSFGRRPPCSHGGQAAGWPPGAVTIVAFPITQIYRAHPGAIAIGSGQTNLWWPLVSAVALVALVAAAHAVVRAARLRPHATGSAGDLVTDLRRVQPVAVRIAGGSVNRIAFVIGTGLAILITLAVVAESDTYHGILRGLLEGGAFVAGYAVPGRYLGIRR